MASPILFAFCLTLASNHNSSFEIFHLIRQSSVCQYFPSVFCLKHITYNPLSVLTINFHSQQKSIENLSQQVHTSVAIGQETSKHTGVPKLEVLKT